MTQKEQSTLGQSKILGRDDEKFTDPLSSDNHETEQGSADNSEEPITSVEATDLSPDSDLPAVDSDVSRSVTVPLSNELSTSDTSLNATTITDTSSSDSDTLEPEQRSVSENAINEVKSSWCSLILEYVLSEYAYYFIMIVTTLGVLIHVATQEFGSKKFPSAPSDQPEP